MGTEPEIWPWFNWEISVVINLQNIGLRPILCDG